VDCYGGDLKQIDTVVKTTVPRKWLSLCLYYYLALYDISKPKGKENSQKKKNKKWKWQKKSSTVVSYEKIRKRSSDIQ